MAAESDWHDDDDGTKNEFDVEQVSTPDLKELMLLSRDASAFDSVVVEDSRAANRDSAAIARDLRLLISEVKTSNIPTMAAP
jgi:hypothetical protein